MANQTVIKVELQGLQELSKALDSQRVKDKIANKIRGAIRRYLNFHFESASKGKGDWAPLSETTLKRRRSASRNNEKLKEQTSVGQHMKRQAAILRDTGQLFGALDIELESAHGRFDEIKIENGRLSVEFGYGGNDQWIPPNDEDEEPQKKTKKEKKEREPITISALASIHHYGVPGRIPARPIVVPLDEETLREIQMTIEETILKEGI